MENAENTGIKDVILIVDDMEINRAILCEIFREDHCILEAENGRQALDLVMEEKNHVAAVLLDIVMPVMDGFEFLEKFNEAGFRGRIPVFLITADTSETSMYQGYEMGVMDVIEKPIVPYFVKSRVESILELYRARKRLNQVVIEQHGQIRQQEKEIYKLNYAIIETLSAAIEFRSGESGSHVRRIRYLTERLLKELRKKLPDKYNFTDQEIDQISSAAIMHDVGKITVSDSILNKPGKLTAEEYETMKLHTIKGSEILDLIPQFKGNKLYEYAYDICRHHHERWDGNGYPDKLKGEEISIWAQVVSIADVYDALTTERVYKSAFSPEKAIQMINEGQCGQFNPELLDALGEVFKELMSENKEGIDG